MGYDNPWPGIMARKRANEADARAASLQQQLDECRKQVEELRAQLAKSEGKHEKSQ